MYKQTIEFAVETKNGVIQRVGVSGVMHPLVRFKENGSIKWYEDKLKNEDKDK